MQLMSSDDVAVAMRSEIGALALGDCTLDFGS